MEIQDFASCILLTTIDLSGAEFIDDCAFEECSNLFNVGYSLPATTIGENAFRVCSKLLNVRLDNVKTIKDRAFEFCEKLTIEGLKNVEEIGVSAFAGLSFSDGIVTPPLLNVVRRNTYACTDCNFIEITTNIRGIHDSAFSFNIHNKHVKIDSPYIAIANTAFKGNDVLESITMSII